MGPGAWIVPFAINIDGVVFPRPDVFLVVISVDGQSIKRLPVRVLHLSQPQPVVK
jgi:hypothetical protein